MKLFSRVFSKLSRVFFFLRHRASFGFLGDGAYLFSPYRIDGAKDISIGRNSVLQKGGWLYCNKIEGNSFALSIGGGCVLGYNNHITAIKHVVIGDHVLTANNVYISDNGHGYEDIHTPIMNQSVLFKGPVEIGSGSWLGENVCVVAAKIGKNCFIGANSVVTKDIPDYSVAVGAPAMVIRRFDVTLGRWV